jgi:hypothetical protein
VFLAFDKLFGFTDFVLDFPFIEHVFLFSVNLFEVKDIHDRELFFRFFLYDDSSRYLCVLLLLEKDLFLT